MTDLDQLLRADARDWRSTQSTDLDLEVALQRSVHDGAVPARRPRALAAAAAAVVVVAAAVTLAARHQGHAPHHGGATPAAPVSSVPVSSPAARPTAPRLSGLGRPDAGQRTLLSASGTINKALPIAVGRAPEIVYAACIGGGTISVAVPGQAGVEVGCDGGVSGVGLPGVGRSLLVTGVGHQQWRVAVFGR